jgi:hypothetical protein
MNYVGAEVAPWHDPECWEKKTLAPKGVDV